ncbi:MAG: hypothetical protein Q8N51_02810, partial [Gammaproteobacteria bacterium]|nr:hypothetical protein [Gammaproteobacteria bacterium]
MSPSSSRWPPGPAVATVAATVLAAVLAFGAYVLQSKAGGVAGLLSSRHLVRFATVLAVVATAALCLYAAALRGSTAGSSRQFLMPLLGSIGVIVLALVAAELTLRSLAAPTPIGLRVGNLDLLPYDWDQVRQSSLSWLQRTRGDEAVFELDDAELGWNVGRGRRSHDGRYATSAEGLRSAEPGQVLSSLPAASRVALIGDSFTFGEE